MILDAQTSVAVAGYSFTGPPVRRLTRLPQPRTNASPVTPETTVISEELRREIREDFRRIYYHEAGHAVAFHWFGFRPTGIIMEATYFDARTIKFMRGKIPSLRTCRVRERAVDLAVCLIAGIAAESIILRMPLISLRDTTGAYDYESIGMIRALMLGQRQYEFTHRVAKSQLEYWEAEAVAFISHKPVWTAVKSVVVELRRHRGILTQDQTVGAIERVLGPRPRQRVRER